MPATRYYYSDSISEFLTRSAIAILGALAVSYTNDINKQTSNSWREEIETLQQLYLHIKIEELSILSITFLAWDVVQM